jgi:hypothetical protein
LALTVLLQGKPLVAAATVLLHYWHIHCINQALSDLVRGFKFSNESKGRQPVLQTD